MKHILGAVLFLLFTIYIPNVGAQVYKGCFKDTSSRDLSEHHFSSGNMTTQRCIDACRAKGFNYAATQFSSHCFCSNSYGKYGTAVNCNMPCSGDAGEICGGGWANSVYVVSNSNAPAPPPSPTHQGSSASTPIKHVNLHGQWQVEDAANGKNKDYHAIPWSFTSERTVYAQGYWRGLWEPLDLYRIKVVLMDKNANTDTFVISFSKNGTEFTAFKNGKPYRYGIRK
jgi:WSC domain